MPVDLHALLEPSRTAIVTSEVQNGVVGEPSALPALAEAAAAEMLPNLRKLLPVARAAGVQVVHCTAYRRDDAKGELDIFEYQVGLQYDRPLKFIPANAFFRTAFEYQNWDIDGKPTGGAGFGGTIGEITTNSFSSANLGAAHLYGVTIGTGFTW